MKFRLELEQSSIKLEQCIHKTQKIFHKTWSDFPENFGSLKVGCSKLLPSPSFFLSGGSKTVVVSPQQLEAGKELDNYPQRERERSLARNEIWIVKFLDMPRIPLHVSNESAWLCEIISLLLVSPCRSFFIASHQPEIQIDKPTFRSVCNFICPFKRRRNSDEKRSADFR